MEKWLKIAMLIDWWEPIFWWWQVHVKQLCYWLVNNHNCEVDLFVRKLKNKNWLKYIKDEILLDWKLKIYRVWPTTKFFNLFWRLISLINTTIFLLIKSINEKYDVIHAHAYLSWLPAKIVWYIFKIPVVYTVHWFNNLDIKKVWFINIIEKWLLTWIKYDLEISVWKSFLRYKNVNKNIKIIPNWVDVKKFNEIKVYKKYNWFNFLWVWRFSWEKWLEYLIKWIWLIDKSFLEKKWFKLNLVWDWEDKEKIVKLILDLKLSKFVNIKWKLFWDDLIKEYKKNHIFILPSLSEWFGLVLIEAMASKLTIISTKCGWPEEIVEENNNGFLIKKWSFDEIKNIVEKVLNLDNLILEKLWKEWYKKVNEKYIINNTISSIYFCYIELIKIK